MPKTRALTQALRDIDYAQEQRQRMTRILKATMVASGFDAQELADTLEMPVSTLRAKLRGDREIKWQELLSIARVLKLDDDTRAALLGAERSCRWEV